MKDVRLPRQWLNTATAPALLCAIGLATAWGAETVSAPSTLAWLGYALAYVAGGLPSLIEGVRSLRHKVVDADLLMVIGAVGAASIGHWGEGATLLLIFATSHALEAYAMNRSRQALSALVTLRPAEAAVETPHGLVHKPIDEVAVGDVVLIRPGERIPVDGTVIEGTSSVDEATITGESMPVQKRAGDPVYAGTLNQFGALRVAVTRRADDTTLAKIIRLVEDASAQKATAQRWIDRIAPVYGLVVLAMAGLALFAPGVWTELTWADRVYRAVTLLVVASPCALVASITPAVLSAIANASRRGVLFKGGVPLERLAAARVFAFDKTGTLTVGRPRVLRAIAHRGDVAELLRLAAAAESLTEHPIGRAIVDHAAQQGIPVRPETATAGQTLPGYGVVATVEGRRLCLGKPALLARAGIPLPRELLDVGERLEARGQTVVYVAEVPREHEEGVVGLIAVADAIRPSARAALASLRALGIGPLVVLTGDHEGVGRAVAAAVGADEVRAMLLPEEKVAAIRELDRRYGPVVMVGDGVNDAPALAAAWVGVAMGAAGTDVAIETADVALMSDELHLLPRAVEIARATRRIVRQNLAFATLVIAGLVGATVLFGMPLSLAVLGHEGSTLLVIANGLRMLHFQPALSVASPALDRGTPARLARSAPPLPSLREKEHLTG